MTTDLEALRQRFEQKLTLALQEQYQAILPVSPALVAAMDYSMEQGGKRIRPLLVYASTLSAGGRIELADAVAIAIEMIHGYSLIHDDLPAMDDDDLRRGKASCHIAHGEAMAILSGDGLQALAFSHLVTALRNRNAQQAFAIMELISHAAIAMVSGQALDICSVGIALDKRTLESMHRHKTGALIRACVVAGGYCTAHVVDAGQQRLLQDIGNALGLAFQVQDDLLDEVGATIVLGKPQGSDNARNKPTYPSVIGVDASQQLADALHLQVTEMIAQLKGDTSALTEVCGLLYNRCK